MQDLPKDIESLRIARRDSLLAAVRRSMIQPQTYPHSHITRNGSADIKPFCWYTQFIRLFRTLFSSLYLEKYTVLALSSHFYIHHRLQPIYMQVHPPGPYQSAVYSWGRWATQWGGCRSQSRSPGHPSWGPTREGTWSSLAKAMPPPAKKKKVTDVENEASSKRKKCFRSWTNIDPRTQMHK